MTGTGWRGGPTDGYKTGAAMFTGLIEGVGQVKSAQRGGVGVKLKIELGRLAEGTRQGDSISVNGVCLTVSNLQGQWAEFDVTAETLRAGTLGRLKPGSKVNLERALQWGGRIGGHLVQGHVDGTGTVRRREHDRGAMVLWVGVEAELAKLMLPKGSVALDGVSLTVVEAKSDCFSVYLIPTTLKETQLGVLQPGDEVNIEADIIGKWINRRLDEIIGVGAAGGATLEKLRRQGFAS